MIEEALDLDALPAAYREGLAFFEAYRRLGFPSDQIFAVLAGCDGAVQLNIELHADGAECVATVGYFAETLATVWETWRSVAVAVAEGRVSTEQIDRIWPGSMAQAQFLAMPGVLAQKGIRVRIKLGTVN